MSPWHPRWRWRPPISFKIGHDQAATHPVHLRLVEAAERIKLQTNGQFLLQVFANSQLGGDTDMLTQTRSGALEMVLMPDIILGTLVPLASINAMGFAFDNEVDVHAAMDGDLGAPHPRQDRRFRTVGYEEFLGEWLPTN